MQQPARQRRRRMRHVIDELRRDGNSNEEIRMKLVADGYRLGRVNEWLAEAPVVVVQ